MINLLVSNTCALYEIQKCPKITTCAERVHPKVVNGQINIVVRH